MARALIMMTALVPTTGHADLIEFAAGLDVDAVDVMVNTRSFEPVPGPWRGEALAEHFDGEPRVTVRQTEDDDAPQEPQGTDDEAFWAWWKEKTFATFPEARQAGYDFVVASEGYGARLAEEFEAVFLPYDIDRTLNPARGRDVRTHLWEQWEHVLPAIRRHLGVTITLFGQESVGKTTTSRALSARWGQKSFLHEWARPYLEFEGGDLTQEQMLAIEQGQAALQRMFQKKALYPVTVQDTDLFSTVGYYDICDGDMEMSDSLPQVAADLASDRYYVLPDNIPFEPDVLRYGGDRRQSSMAFWLDLAEQHGLDCVFVPGWTLEERVEWIARDAEELFKQKNGALAAFLRE